MGMLRAINLSVQRGAGALEVTSGELVITGRFGNFARHLRIKTNEKSAAKELRLYESQKAKGRRFIPWKLESFNKQFANVKDHRIRKFIGWKHHQNSVLCILKPSRRKTANTSTIRLRKTCNIQ